VSPGLKRANQSRGLVALFKKNSVVNPIMRFGGTDPFHNFYNSGAVYVFRKNSVVKPVMLYGDVTMPVITSGLVHVFTASTSSSGPKQTWG
jgi:hypothetical protein